LNLLSAMITPAVLISACGTLIFSTSTRLSRIVDRVRALGQEMESLARGPQDALAAERRIELERQLASRAQRGRLIQRSLTSLYVSLGLFVGATVCIALTGIFPRTEWIPTALGVGGTLALFNGCVLLIRETQIALRFVDSEMEFMLRLPGLYRRQADAPGKE
jgi:hypothetical protein